MLFRSDVVVYMTRTGDYDIYSTGRRVLTAVLEVEEIYPTHEAAAQWYRAKGMTLPSDCMVAGNPPFRWEQTAGVNSRDFDNVAEWDAFYQARAERIPVFIRTQALFCEIHHPPVVTNEMLVKVFGKILHTQTPPTLTEKQLEELLQGVGVELTAILH